MNNHMRQVRLDRYGAPGELRLVETTIPRPQAGEVLVKVEAIGINYADTLRRRNLYFQPTPLPYVIGTEAAGEVVALGEGVGAPYAVGTSVLAILPAGGGYAEYVLAKAAYCVPLPPHVNTKTATGIFVQGSTAQLMISRVAGALQGKTVLINAAAGGVGSLLVQLAKLRGARVIAASGSAAKLERAKENGADLTVDYSLPDWSVRVRAMTDGEGVDLAFEMVGGEVYNQTVKSLAPGGHLIVYGCASGVQGSVHPERFVDESLRQTGFNLAHWITTQPELWQEALGSVIALVAEGKLRIDTSHSFPLREAAEAHRQIEARQTTGKVVLLP